MTRTTDPKPEPFKPLGPVVPRAKPEQPKPSSQPHGEYGVTTGPDGRMKTTRNPYQF